MNKLFSPLMAIALSIFCCCPYSSFARDLSVQKPNSADVVGTYQLTSQNLSGYGLEADALQDKQPEITIKADGSCRVADFPVWKATSSGYLISDWLSFEGQWKTIVVGSVRRGNTTYNNWGIACGADAQAIPIGELTGTESPYGLLFIYGDPDSGTAMSFTTQP